MQAIAFNTAVTHGQIRVPEQYLGKIPSPVRVIILAGELSRRFATGDFSALKLKTKGFKFDREQANAR